MKKMYYYLPIALATLAFGESCSNKASKSTDVVTLDITNLDTTVAPGNDFYRFATGTWADKNPLKDEYSRFGSFDQLAENNQKQIKQIIEDLGETTHEQGSIAQKIGDLYKLGMDSVKLNNDGATPLKSQLELIASAADKNDIIRLTAEISQYARSPFFNLYVGADDKNSSVNIVQTSQGGLGLGEREYYLSNEENMKSLREGYKTLIQKQFVNVGYTTDDATKASNDILNIEIELAKAHFPKEKTREPEANYHKMSVSDLNEKIANFNWKVLFEAAKAKDFTEINISQVEPIAAAIRLIGTAPIEALKEYLSWCVIDAAASYLSDNFVNANFDFYGKQMSGRQVIQPRWKRTVSTVGGVLSEAVGEMYVEKYFPAESKARMIKLVKNLQVTLGERITNLTWMSDLTKEKAKEKLNTFTVKIGYPDKWKDYSSLKVKADDSYWANIVRANQFGYDEMIGKINKPVDKSEWHMPPQMVNAYYNPTTNEICFPAGILQPPFFYTDGDDAINYGGIGVVIGHEMSHGFDDQGSQFDKDGNLSNWWTKEDATKFKERAQVLVNRFNNIEVLPGLMANGQYTLGENIGDFGGLQIAYNAFEKTQEAKSGEKIDGFTPQQRFFLSYGMLWAGHIREAEIRRLTQTDPHALGKWRVNGTLPMINAWYDAFNIAPTDSLYIPKEERADIW